MIDNKRELEREELYKSIWKIAEELRGSVDGWDFKSYVIGMMFYRYISENITAYINKGEHEDGNTSFDYADLTDEVAEEARKGLVEEKGFFILPSELFCNVRKNAKNDKNLNETLEKVFRHIEESAKGSVSESDFTGLFDDIDVNSNKLGSTVEKKNEKLVEILNAIGEMKLGNYQDNSIDAVGDAYEFLMGMYASNAGKSGGEYYTPQEVSELLTRLATVGKTEVNKVYDPACGSGSLLLKAIKVLGKDNIKQGFYGQEKNITTYNLCRINMFLHDVDFDKFNIACDDTLTNPQHWDDEPFDVIVSNPPYSIKWKGDDEPLLMNDERFAPAGVLAPKEKADFAFIMHMLSWLSSNGKAAIICYTGILYRGGAEQKIRKYLVDNNYIECIIQMPDNLFFGTTTTTSILVLSKAKRTTDILFIDAKDECKKITNNNLLTSTNINNIMNIYLEQKIIENKSKVITYEQIKNKKYKLSVATYLEKKIEKQVVDISNLNSSISKSVEKQNFIRININNLEENINKLNCSISYEKIPLNEILFYEQPGKYIVSSTDYLTNGTPVLTAGQSLLLGYTNEDFGIFYASKENPVIIFDDFTTSFHWIDFDFKVKSSAMKMLRLKPEMSDKIDFRYVYFMMRNIDYKPYDHTRQWIDKYSKFEINIPEINIQKDIAKKLDYFTELNAELNAELLQRKKQYEYYRNKLLNFK